MHRQCYPYNCNKNYYKQDGTGCKDFIKCKNYIKESRNPGCTGPSKGFVQNLKDKLVQNLQNDSHQFEFSRKPIKKKQKDYNCILLSKINNLDKKLQNLEHLFTSHLSHSQNEVLNSSNSEPVYDYMHFYESVRSLADLANRLKEDILYKQCDNHSSNRNTSHFGDRIQILDSELQNLYTYLDQLPNCWNGKKDRKRFLVQDPKDVTEDSREGSKVEIKRFSDFKEPKRPNKIKRSSKKYSKDCSGDDSSCCCEECCYGSDDNYSNSCGYSGCNLNAGICEYSPAKRNSPKQFDCCPRESTKYFDCTCELCVKERSKRSYFRKKKQRMPQSSSSCSCEICESNKWNPCNQNHNSAWLKIVKPVRKYENGNGFDSYSESKPSKNNKKKQKNKNKNVYKDSQDIYFNSQDDGAESNGPNLKNEYRDESKGIDNMGQSQNKITVQNTKTIPPPKNQDSRVQNLVYLELTPDLNIITKRKNNRIVLNNSEGMYQVKNENGKKQANMAAKNEKESKTNSFYRQHTANYHVRDGNRRDFPNKNIQDKRNYGIYRDSDQNITNPSGGNNRSQTNNPTGKHLHIKINKKREFEEGMFYGQRHDAKRSFDPHHRHIISRCSPRNHRKHDGYCHFQHGKFDTKVPLNKNYQKIHPCHNVSSESESFDTEEENESSTESSTSNYKLFLCKKPNCFDKLDSDEVIMLMNRKDLKKGEGCHYKLDVTQNLKDLKSDVCEKCMTEEKIISVTPQKTKNKTDDGERNVIYKKEMTVCSNCKNNKNDKLGKTVKTNIEYFEIDSESEEKEQRLQTKKSSNSNKKSSNKSNPDQENRKNEYNSENTNKNNIKNQKGNQQLSNNHSQMTVAHSNINQHTSLKTAKDDSTKELEVPPVGNLININIERGSYSFKQMPDPENVTEVSPLPKITSSVKKNSGLPRLNTNNLNIVSSSSKTNGYVKLPRNVSEEIIIAHSIHQNDEKSRSTIDLSSNNVELKKMSVVKSDVLTKLVGQAKHDDAKTIDVINRLNKSTMKSNDENIDPEKQNEKVQIPATDNHSSAKKDISLVYKSDKYKNLEYPATQVGHHSSLKKYSTLSNTQTALGKNFVKPKTSLTKVKKNRLKYNKKFGSSLSRVSSVNSLVVHRGKFHSGPTAHFKRSIIFNQGQRTNQLSKHRSNGYKNLFYVNDNSLSRVLNPHTTVLVQKSYLNNFKLPSNNLSDSRYQVETISNYLSSTVVAESSYSTINWETVAKKLKDDKYFNN